MVPFNYALNTSHKPCLFLTIIRALNVVENFKTFCPDTVFFSSWSWTLCAPPKNLPQLRANILNRSERENHSLLWPFFCHRGISPGEYTQDLTAFMLLLSRFFKIRRCSGHVQTKEINPSEAKSYNMKTDFKCLINATKCSSKFPQDKVKGPDLQRFTYLGVFTQLHCQWK